MHQYDLYGLILLLIVAGMLPVIILVRYGARMNILLNGRELAAVGKILFVIVAIMVLVVFRSTVETPAGQFIYGRF